MENDSHTSNPIDTDKIVYLLDKGESGEALTVLLESAEQNKDRALIEATIRLAYRYNEIELLYLRGLLLDEYVIQEKGKIMLAIYKLIQEINSGKE